MLIFTWQEPGSFRQAIHYRADLSAIEVLVNRSLACSQQLTYDCRGASLLDQGEFIASGLEGLRFWWTGLWPALNSSSMTAGEPVC